MTNGVEFDIDSEPRAVVQTKTPAMVKLVIKLSGGLVKDSTQANYVLIGFAIVVFTISFFLFLGGGGTGGYPKDVKILPAVL